MIDMRAFLFNSYLAPAAGIFALLFFARVSPARGEDSGESGSAELDEQDKIAIQEMSYPGVDPEKGGIAPLMEKARNSKINVVTWPGFQMIGGGGGSRVFVQILKGSTIDAVDQPVRVEDPPFKVGPNTLVYRFPESIVLLKNNYNPLISKYFNTPVLKAKMKRFKKRVYLIIELRTAVSPLREKFIPYQNDLYFFFIEFESGSYLPQPASGE
jgi:hypothetical protein